MTPKSGKYLMESGREIQSLRRKNVNFFRRRLAIWDTLLRKTGFCRIRLR